MKSKKLFPLFILAWMLFRTNTLHAQSSTGQNEVNKYAGAELLKASNHFYTGFWLQVGGGLGIIIGYSMNASQPGNGAAVIVVGSLLVLTGQILQFESYSHIGKAGRILMGERLGLGTTRMGNVGLSYTF